MMVIMMIYYRPNDNDNDDGDNNYDGDGDDEDDNDDIHTYYHANILLHLLFAFPKTKVLQQRLTCCI